MKVYENTKIINAAYALIDRLDTNEPEKIINMLPNMHLGYTQVNPDAFKACIRNINDNYSILYNKNYKGLAKKLLLAHELGHAIFHKEVVNYMGNKITTSEDIIREHEANLFAIALVLGQDYIGFNLDTLSPYETSTIMDMNVKL